MAVIVSLLRGVNVGKHHRIRMDLLRGVYEALGFPEARILGQVGNVVFETDQPDLDAVAKRIEKAFERKFGFHSDVILRTGPELKKVGARNPFAARRGIEPSRLAVTFLASDPSREARAKALAVQAGPEEFHLERREIYIYFPNGMARPKISPALFEKILGTPGTSRNWNTVRQLLEASEAFHKGPEKLR